MSLSQPHKGEMHFHEEVTINPRDLNNSSVDRSAWIFTGKTWSLVEYQGARRGYIYGSDLPYPMQITELRRLRQRLNQEVTRL